MSQDTAKTVLYVLLGVSALWFLGFLALILMRRERLSRVARNVGLGGFVVLAIPLAAAAVVSERDDEETTAGPKPESVASLTEAPTQEWITNGGSLSNQRYSQLDEITPDNVGGLKGVWWTKLGSGAEAKYSGEAQPIVHDGTILISTGADDVFALDARTGRSRWVYRGKLPDQLPKLCCGWVSRGVGLGDGKVYLGRLDGDLVALDERTGKQVWRTQVAQHHAGFSITSAPLYYDGMVITGVAGGEYGIRGRVTAFDADTGDEIWRAYTIPAPGEPGHETWPQGNGSWKTGGAPVWHTPAVDPELGLLYVATGNPGPDFNAAKRAGENLYADSILALDAKTGKQRWHYQTVHHDIWDYDPANPTVLVDLRDVGGRDHKALAQVSKTGWVYVLDRETGKPIHGIDERPVPQEPRQRTHPMQPYPRGEAFVPQQVGPAEKRKVPKGFKLVNDGKIFTPYWRGPTVVKPPPIGAANWPPSSYDPDRQYLYVCARDQAGAYVGGRGGELGGEFAPPPYPGKGRFVAMDMTTNRMAWKADWSDPCYSGSVATKGGVVFVGHNDGRYLAYDSESGRPLWEWQTGAGVNAPGTVFEMDGHQHVVIYSAGAALAGDAHGDNVWLFSLDGSLRPAGVGRQAEAQQHGGGTDDPAKPTPQDTGAGATAGGEGAPQKDYAEGEKQAEKQAGGDPTAGEAAFASNCSGCHGADARGGNGGPSLVGAGPRAAIVKQIRNGGNGMPPFQGTLDDKAINDVAAYVESLGKGAR